MRIGSAVGLALLLVGNARSQDMSVIATEPWRVERTLPMEGDNLRQVVISADGKTGYVANMKNRGFATTQRNIDLGWVLGQRLTRVTLDGSGPSYLETPKLEEWPQVHWTPDKAAKKVNLDTLTAEEVPEVRFEEVRAVAARCSLLRILCPQSCHASAPDFAVRLLAPTHCLRRPAA